MAELDSSTLLSLSNVLDISQLDNLDVNSQEFKTYLTSLSENVNDILKAINEKDVGIYSPDEMLSGKSYYNEDSQEQDSVYRKIIIFGALPDTATKQVVHGLDSTWSYKFTRIYGTASDTTNKVYLPLPYATSTAADIIELSVDATNINITTGKDRTSFDVVKVVIEYIE